MDDDQTSDGRGYVRRHIGSGDAGTGLVGTLVGFAIFMLLLLLATQLVLRLYATTVINSAADRAAETVAQSPVPSASVAAAEEDARSSLGGFGAAHTSFDWLEVDGQQVVLRVRATPPVILPDVPGWGLITRTVTVRTERFR